MLYIDSLNDVFQNQQPLLDRKTLDLIDSYECTPDGGYTINFSNGSTE